MPVRRRWANSAPRPAAPALVATAQLERIENVNTSNNKTDHPGAQPLVNTVPTPAANLHQVNAVPKPAATQPPVNSTSKQMATSQVAATPVAVANDEQPDAEDKTMGQIERAADGTLLWVNQTSKRPSPAVYHHEIRQELLDLASQNGAREYEQKRREGIDPSDKTAYHPWQHDWSPQRALWGRITHDILNQIEKAGYGGFWKNLPRELWTYKGRLGGRD